MSGLEIVGLVVGGIASLIGFTNSVYAGYKLRKGQREQKKKTEEMIKNEEELKKELKNVYENVEKMVKVLQIEEIEGEEDTILITEREIEYPLIMNEKKYNNEPYKQEYNPNYFIQNDIYQQQQHTPKSDSTEVIVPGVKYNKKTKKIILPDNYFLDDKKNL